MQWDLYRNINIFVQDNAFENLGAKRRPFCFGSNVSCMVGMFVSPGSVFLAKPLADAFQPMAMQLSLKSYVAVELMIYGYSHTQFLM